MGSSARRLANLLPAMLCALWSLLLVPASAAPAQSVAAASAATAAPVCGFPAASAATAAPVCGFPAASAATAAPVRGLPAASTAHPTFHQPAPRATTPEPHLAPAAIVGLPAAVENPVRFPAAPAAPAAAPADLSVPVRGLLEGDPRRERAPPGGPHGPRESRGPPSTRHS
ncbi:hypothetical protein ACIGN6_02610 [Streptomyces sp. NPDC053792]|uniref:hypothetical protein n=1 Tax=Streptomyces sp. NPDC053792 TaxID=3365716 RepID=UPI0037D109E9